MRGCLTERRHYGAGGGGGGGDSSSNGGGPRYRQQTAAIPHTARLNNVRALRSVYAPEGKGSSAGGKSSTTSITAKGGAGGSKSGVGSSARVGLSCVKKSNDVSKVWNRNKPTNPSRGGPAAPATARSYSVYDKQKKSPSIGKQPPKQQPNVAKKWNTSPPTLPLKMESGGRRLKSNKGQRGYDMFYINCSHQKNDKTTTTSSEMSSSDGFVARRQKLCNDRSLNRTTKDNHQVTSIKKKDNEKHLRPSCRQFHRPPSAGERYAEKKETENGEIKEMCALIRAVKKTLSNLAVEDVPPLPPPPQFAGESPRLRRYKTEIVFCMQNCKDQTILEYARRLPQV